MDDTFMITARADNIFRVLQRMASLITRHRLKMQQINVTEADGYGMAHVSLTLHTDEESMNKLFKQLRKMMDLIDVKMSLKKN